MSTPNRRSGSGGAGRRRSLPLVPLALVAIAVLAVIAFALSGGDGDSDAVQETAPVAVEGNPLPPYEGQAADPAVGMPAPALEGSDFNGSGMTFDPGEHPSVILFAAHWCSFCQEEVKDLAPWLADGGAGEINFMTITTSVEESRPNYPPSAWFEREGWPGAVMVDSPNNDAANAFGVTSFPFFVFVDGDGNVVGRAAGNLGAERLEQAFGELLR